MSDKLLVRALNDGVRFFESQDARRRGRDDANKVEGFMVTALKVLATSPDWPRYRDRIRRRRLADPIRDRKNKYLTKKWSKEFARLLKVAISDLEALPREVVTPLGSNSTPAQIRQRREAIRKRWERFRMPATHSTPGYETEILTLQNKGFANPKTATFGESVVSGILAMGAEA